MRNCIITCRRLPHPVAQRDGEGPGTLKIRVASLLKSVYLTGIGWEGVGDY